MASNYALTAIHRDEGSIVVFEGWRVPRDGEPRDSRTYLIAVDHRMARDLYEVIQAGEAPVAQAEEWQIVGSLA